MSGSGSKKRTGTRRSTILNRRAGKTARLIYYARRFGILAGVVAMLGYGGYTISHSGWWDETSARMDQSFDEAMADAGFRVSNLLIEGRDNVDRQTLKDILRVEKNRPLFAYDLTDIKARLEQISWVKTATVERRLPSTLYVRLEERAPIALWQRRGKLALVDREGIVLTDQNLARYQDMIIIVGDGAPQNAGELIALINAEPEIAKRVEAAKWIGGRRWDLALHNGIAIRLPEDDAGLAIKRLADAQKSEGVLDRQLLAVDLRDENRIVVQTEPGSVDKYEANYKKEKSI